MKPKSMVTFLLGLFLFLLGVLSFVFSKSFYNLIPTLIGLSLCYLGFKGGKTALIIFGHTCIVIGCYLITMGIYLLPYSKPIPLHVFTRPLFWGFFSMLGGVCANYHGFCNCMRKI